MKTSNKKSLLVAKQTLLATVISVIVAVFSLMLSLPDKHSNHLEISMTGTLSSTLRIDVNKK